MENDKNKPDYFKLVGYDSYSEGWGSYSEKLGDYQMIMIISEFI